MPIDDEDADEDGRDDHPEVEENEVPEWLEAIREAQTIQIAPEEQAEHLAYGDVMGPCDRPLQAIRLAKCALDPSACCHDSACDRDAFRRAGGVCSGDEAIRGPLPVHAPASHP